DLASRDAIQTECLDQIVNPACTDSLDVRLAQDGFRGALHPFAWLQQARKVAAVTHPWHLEIQRADARVPGPVAIRIPLSISFTGAFVALGPNVSGDLHFHQRLAENRT